MRGFISSIALATAAVLYPGSTAIAAPKKSPPQTECQKEAEAGRVRADGIYDLETGAKIYASLTDEQITTTPIHAASLTKVEGIKEMARRVWAGLWARDKTFEVANRANKDKPQTRDLSSIARLSMVTSFNVLDQVARAEPDFMKGIRDHIKRIGMTKTEYLSPTGDPDGLPGVRQKHLTTLGDLVISIRDYHLNYTDPEKLQKAFGRTQISGLPNVDDIPNIHRSQTTLTLLEGAEGKNANPVPGVTDGKTAYTCAAGWGEYFKYTFNNRAFIFITLGHNSADERQKQALRLIDTNKPLLTAFIEKATPRPVEIKSPPLPPVQTTMMLETAAAAASAASAVQAELSFDPE